jgi:hypothetical protein
MKCDVLISFGERQKLNCHKSQKGVGKTLQASIRRWVVVRSRFRYVLRLFPRFEAAALLLGLAVPIAGAAPGPPNYFVVLGSIKSPSSAVPELARFDINGHAQGNVLSFLFDNVGGIAFGPDGNLYVLTKLAQVVVFDGLSLNNIGPAVNLQFLGFSSGLTFGPDGNMYVGDIESGFIARYCGPLNQNCSLGTPLPALGQPLASAIFVSQFVITNGSSMAFGPDGNLYATSGSVVLRYCGPLQNCAEGTPLRSASGQAGNVAAFTPGVTEPLMDLTFGPDGDLYVLASEGGIFRSVLHFAGPHSALPEGYEISVLVMANPSEPFGGSGMDFGPDGNLYVSGTNGVAGYNGPKCGAPLTCQGLPNGAGGSPILVPANSTGIVASLLRFNHFGPGASASSTLVVLAGDQQSVKRFNALTGTPMPGKDAGGHDLAGADFATGFKPSGLAFGPDGNLYAGDATASEVHVMGGSTGQPLVSRSPVFVTGINTDGGLTFSSDGLELLVAGGGQANVFSWPGAQSVGLIAGNVAIGPGLTFGPDGNVYLVDVPDSTLARVNLAFPGQADFVPNGGQVSSPFDVAVSPIDQNLYVSDRGTGEIDRYDPQTGGFKDVFIKALPGNPAPSGLAFDPTGSLYVAYSDGQIRRYSSVTRQLENIAGTITADPSFITVGTANEGSDVVTPPSTVSIGGHVFGGTTGNPIASAQVLVGVLFGNLLGCPALLLGPCASTLTDVHGTYDFNSLRPGNYVLTTFPPANVNFFPGSVSVSVPNGGDTASQEIILTAPPPVPPTVQLTGPAGALSTVNGVPLIQSSDSTSINVTGCPRGTATYSLSINFSNVLTGIAPGFTGNIVASGQLVETPFGSGTFDATIPALTGQRGLVNFSIAFACPSGATSSQTFLVYIDPSGTVVDDVTGRAIPGATVTLLRSDTSHGTFAVLPPGSALMSLSNRRNPDQTNVMGEFGWDVAPGFYMLQASAPGYTCNAASPPAGFTCVGNAVQSGAISIPPAAVNLRLPLHQGATGPVNVSNQVSVTSTGFVFSRVTHTFNGTLTVKNTIAPSISGPIQVVLTNLSTGVTLANASGTTNGSPFVTVTSGTGLAPGKSTSTNLQFNNPSNASIKFTAVTYSGSF